LGRSNHNQSINRRAHLLVGAIPIIIIAAAYVRSLANGVFAAKKMTPEEAPPPRVSLTSRNSSAGARSRQTAEIVDRVGVRVCFAITGPIHVVIAEAGGVHVDRDGLNDI
jgi:hypothetical protein